MLLRRDDVFESLTGHEISTSGWTTSVSREENVEWSYVDVAYLPVRRSE